jgi:hypothetical protein
MSDTYLRRLVSSFESRPDRVAMRIVGDDREVYTFGRSLDEIRSRLPTASSRRASAAATASRLSAKSPLLGDRISRHALSRRRLRSARPARRDRNDHEFPRNSEAKLAFVDSEQAPRLKQIEERLGRHVPAVVWPKYEPSENGDAPHDVPALTNGSSNGHFAFADWANASPPEEYKTQIPPPRARTSRCSSTPAARRARPRASR